jgi:hypothetical protein
MEAVSIDCSFCCRKRCSMHTERHEKVRICCPTGSTTLYGSFQQQRPLLVVYCAGVLPREQYTKCGVMLTTEIHEVQQQNVTEGDRRRSKSTALTTENCGVFNSCQGLWASPPILIFLPSPKRCHRCQELREMRSINFGEVQGTCASDLLIDRILA